MEHNINVCTASGLYNSGKGRIIRESRTNGIYLTRRRSADLNTHVEDQRDDFEREHGGNVYGGGN